MSFLHEGQRVSYIGDGSDGRLLGDRGQLLVRSGREGHVKWDDGKVTPHELEFLAPSAVQATRHQVIARRTAMSPDGLEDSLEVGPPIATVGVRGVYDTEGGVGVLNVMATTGALASFPEIAQEALGFVAHRIWSDPHVQAVTAQLDDDEAQEIVTLASQALLRDAFGEPDG